jgi:hypothetical protein
MINFNFTVSDVDAENIMGCIDEVIGSNDLAILKLTDAKNVSSTTWFKKNNEYLKELKTKMLNTKV